MHLLPLLLHLLCVLSVPLPVAAQECSATRKCATGCCSEFGFCGTDKARCGDGCLSACDYKLDCDAPNPCADGTCCSKFDFCGFGKGFYAPEKCITSCNAIAQCDPGTFGVELQKCPLNVCCSKFGVHSKINDSPDESAFRYHSDSDSGYDSAHDSESIPGSKLTEQDWAEGLERLRLYRPNFKLMNEGFSKIPEVAEVSMDDLDDESCQSSLKCRAHRMGYDYSKPDERKAYLEKIADKPWTGPKRFQNVFDDRQRRKELEKQKEANNKGDLTKMLEGRVSG